MKHLKFLLVTILLLLLASCSGTGQSAISPVNISAQEQAWINLLTTNGSTGRLRFDLKPADQLHSMKIYVETWENGILLDSDKLIYGGTPDNDGESRNIYFSSETINDEGDDGTGWIGSHWQIGYDGANIKFDTYFPEGFQASGKATSILGNGEGKNKWPITPDEPIILMAVYYTEDGSLSSFNCEYIMENPEVMAEFAYTELVKCEFSTDLPEY